MIELLAQRALVDEVAEAYPLRAVDDAEGDLRVLVAPEDRLRHQELVEIRVEHGAHDRIDAPLVVIDAGGDVGHGLLGSRMALRAGEGRQHNGKGT